MKQTILTRKEIVAANLKKFRKLNKLTQQEVADKIFASQKQYAKYEEKRATPNYEMLFALKELYNLDNIECFFE